MFSEKFKDLGGQYLARTREDLDLLEQFVTKSIAGDTESVVAARNMAHRICGSGAMLGFPEISKISGEIEAIIRVADDGLVSADWAAITTLMQQLANELQHAKQQTSAPS
ncbi:MAG: Hpt domain-containing protein [Steroidobacteraceae bacterium]